MQSAFAIFSFFVSSSHFFKFHIVLLCLCSPHLGVEQLCRLVCLCSPHLGVEQLCRLLCLCSPDLGVEQLWWQLVCLCLRHLGVEQKCRLVCLCSPHLGQLSGLVFLCSPYLEVDGQICLCSPHLGVEQHLSGLIFLCSSHLGVEQLCSAEVEQQLFRLQQPQHRPPHLLAVEQQCCFDFFPLVRSCLVEQTQGEFWLFGSVGPLKLTRLESKNS